MKKVIKSTALILTALTVLLCFAGCGAANDAPENPIVCISVVYGENGGAATPDSGSQQQGTPSGGTPAATTAAPTPDQSQAPAGDSQKPTNAPSGGEQNPAGSQGSSGAAATTEEVVNYYKECYAKIASEGKSATLTWNNTTNSPNVLEVGALSSIAGTLMGQFLKEATPNTQLQPADVAPKGVTTCNLTADMVKEATRKDNGSTYEVNIKLNPTQDNPDVNPTFGGGKAGTIVDVVIVDDITGAAGSFINFDDVKNVYFDTEITATIDKATGHITELYTKSPSIMSFGKVAVKPLGVPSIENAKIGLTYENRYTIAY